MSAGFCPTFGFSGSAAFRLAISAPEVFSAPGMTCCSPALVLQFLSWIGSIATPSNRDRALERLFDRTGPIVNPSKNP
jgi:hypothetical protein